MGFQEGYKKGIESYGVALGSFDADSYVKKVQSSIDKTIISIETRAQQYQNNTADQIKGFITENWHTGTYNIDAVRNGLDGYSAKTIKSNIPGDIKVETPNRVKIFELKTHKDAISSAKEISKAKYDDMGKVVPEDQLESVKEFARRQELRNSEIRPPVSDSYKHTKDFADKKISENANSTPISEHSSKEMAKELKSGKGVDDKKYGLTTENYIEYSDIIRESAEAGLNAAIITAVIKSAPSLMKMIKEFKENGFIREETLGELTENAVYGFGEGALRGGVAASITACCKSGIFGEALKTVDPAVIGAATVVAMNSISNAIKLHNGEITQAEFAEKSLKDSFIVSSGVIGAHLGQGLIPVPVLGAIVGNFIGSTIASIVYDQSKTIFIGILIENDIAFFNIVTQDYELPKEVLEKIGLDTVTIDEISIDTNTLDTVNLSTFDTARNDFIVLRRGLIKVNTIGYIY